MIPLLALSECWICYYTMCWWLPRLSLCGLRGLTSIIDHRMKTHYKRSALCLAIRVTEKGLSVVAASLQLSSWQNHSLRLLSGHTRQKQNQEILLKPLICNLLTLVAHQGYKLSENLQFLPSVDKHSPRVSFTNGQRSSPDIALSLSGIKECKYTTNKFLLDPDGGLGRREGNENGDKTKVDFESVCQLVSKDALALDLLAPSFQIAT